MLHFYEAEGLVRERKSCQKNKKGLNWSKTQEAMPAFLQTTVHHGCNFPLLSKRFAARYFNDAPPVFQRLFFTSEESSAVQYGPRRMKLRDLMGATLRFLQSDCAKFRMLWDWSPCVSQLLTSDVMVRGYVPTSWAKWGNKS